MCYASVTHYVGFAITTQAGPGLRGLALGHTLSPGYAGYSRENLMRARFYLSVASAYSKP